VARSPSSGNGVVAYFAYTTYLILFSEVPAILTLPKRHNMDLDYIREKKKQ